MARHNEIVREALTRLRTAVEARNITKPN